MYVDMCVEFGKRVNEARVRVRMRNLRGEVGVEMGVGVGGDWVGWGRDGGCGEGCTR